MRKHDEGYPRHKRDSDEKGTQNREFFLKFWGKELDFEKLVYRFNGLEQLVQQLVLISQVLGKIKKNGDYDEGSSSDTARGTEIAKKPSMIAQAPIVPRSDELDRVSEAQQYLERYQHLERCLVTDSVIAGIAEFYAKIAQLEGEETSEVAGNKALVATRELVRTFRLLNRTGLRAERISRWAELQLSLDTDDEKKAFLCNRLKKVYLKFSRLLSRAYEGITDVSVTYWNYLPVEAQEALESFARKVALAKLEARTQNTSSLESSMLANVDKLTTALVASVFEKVESTDSVPKLHLLKLIESWNLSSDDVQRNSSISLAMTTIQGLTQTLATIPGVQKAEAVADNYNDLHRISFHLKLPSEANLPSEYDTIEDLWETAEKMALRTHRYLRKVTGEKWYFHVVLVEDFSDYPNSNRVIAFAHAKPHNSSSTS